MKDDIVIIGAKRTAIGNFNGSLSGFTAHELGKIVISNLVETYKLPKDKISEVIMGQVLTSASGQNPARQAVINAGLNYTTPAITINQVCGSGLRAVALAYMHLKAGYGDIIIAGGQENMSLSPHSMHLRNGVKMGNASLIDTMLQDGLTDAFHNYHMGITAENIANEFSITRQEQDEFAYHSHMKASKARNEGKFKDEIIPIEIISKKETKIFAEDEFIKPDSSLEALAKLKPAFNKDGTVTAGSASGINDGAAAVIVTTRKLAEELNLPIMSKIVSFGQAGVKPEIMGTGPIEAVKNALAKANWKISDLELIEANEAFASQAIAVNKALGWDTKLVNVNGGAIALGHPIGASGARILVTLLHEMKRCKAKKAVATLCIGGGMGVALCVENELN